MSQQFNDVRYFVDRKYLIFMFMRDSSLLTGPVPDGDGVGESEWQKN